MRERVKRKTREDYMHLGFSGVTCIAYPKCSKRAIGSRFVTYLENYVTCPKCLAWMVANTRSDPATARGAK